MVLHCIIYGRKLACKLKTFCVLTTAAIRVKIRLVKYHIFYQPNIRPKCEFQQCGIITSVDSDEPMQPLLSLETPNDVQSVA